ncbi:MAG: hypothetical protein AAB403_12430, partial [Planctomycetota bacterium]
LATCRIPTGAKGFDMVLVSVGRNEVSAVHAPCSWAMVGTPSRQVLTSGKDRPQPSQTRVGVERSSECSLRATRWW